MRNILPARVMDDDCTWSASLQSIQTPATSCTPPDSPAHSLAPGERRASRHGDRRRAVACRDVRPSPAAPSSVLVQWRSSSGTAGRPVVTAAYAACGASVLVRDCSMIQRNRLRTLQVVGQPVVVDDPAVLGLVAGHDAEDRVIHPFGAMNRLSRGAHSVRHLRAHDRRPAPLGQSDR